MKQFSQVVDIRRVQNINGRELASGPIIYWLSRDQRADDNWALLYAQELARKNKQPLAAVFCLSAGFLEATARQYNFMLRGLKELEVRLRLLNIPFFLLTGEPDKEIATFATRLKAGAIVTDFDPLKIKRRWQMQVSASFKGAFFIVDAHNIVPCWLASQKQEFGAYTIRPKLQRLLPEFLTDFPKLRRQEDVLYKKLKQVAHFSSAPIDWLKVERSLEVDNTVAPVTWLKPGEKAATVSLKTFLNAGLKKYDVERNDPNLSGQSGLSPYLHFGQLSAQRVAWETKLSGVSSAAKAAFLEELIIRRELADNFCYYNNNYDKVAGFPAWARQTLDMHRKDKREYLYSRRQLETAQTHEALWNAAQQEMIKSGKMHGYLRMYWAKKILEWTKSPEQALEMTIYLNDKYELDGRDPNGYTGIAWSLGGVHDRAWSERSIFGKIRYMNENGAKRKFKVQEYIARWNGA